MSEGHLQSIVVESMRDLCRRHGTTLRHEVTASRNQNAANESGKPYDVGILLSEYYLVGMEFKVLENGAFPSWDKEQHQAYLALTQNPRLKLPLFYAYNLHAVPTLNDFLTHYLYDSVLTGTKISQPENLPGKHPTSDNHPTIHEWLDGMLTNPEGLAGNGWSSIILAEDWVFEKFRNAFPSVIWLLVSANPKLRISWALTHDELLAEVTAMEHIWRSAELKKGADYSDLADAFHAAVHVISDYADAVVSNALRQHSSAAEMGDRPAQGDDPDSDDELQGDDNRPRPR